MLQYPQVVILHLHRKGVSDTSGRTRMPPDVIIHGFWTYDHIGHEHSLIADSALTHRLCSRELLTHIDGWPADLGSSARSRARLSGTNGGVDMFLAGAK